MDIEFYIQEKGNASMMISQIYEDIDTYHKMSEEYKDEILYKQLENKLAYFLMKYDIYHQLCEQQTQKQEVSVTENELPSLDVIYENNKEETLNDDIKDFSFENVAISQERFTIIQNKRKSSFFRRFRRKKKKPVEINEVVQVESEEIESSIEEPPIVNVDQYANYGFNQQQLDLINEGLEAGVDVDVYADVSRPSYSMRAILTAMEKGYSYSYLLDKQLSQEQLDVLMVFLSFNYDISLIANPSLSPEEMSLEFVKRHYHQSDLDIQDYNQKQLTEIKRGILNNLDVSYYIDANFNDEQMYMIRRGLEKDVDVSVYAKPEIPVEMMKDKFYELTFKK